LNVSAIAAWASTMATISNRGSFESSVARTG
jgi:hypothetical protein